MSAYLTAEDLRFLMGLIFFPAGLLSIVTGLVMLVRRMVPVQPFS